MGNLGIADKFEKLLKTRANQRVLPNMVKFGERL